MFSNEIFILRRYFPRFSVLKGGSFYESSNIDARIKVISNKSYAEIGSEEGGKWGKID